MGGSVGLLCIKVRKGVGVGAGVGVGELCVLGSWFVVLVFFAFWASGPPINWSISLKFRHKCPLVSSGWGWFGYSTNQLFNGSPRCWAALSESLKRPSVRLGAPTACARHWLSQRKTVHQKTRNLSRKFVVENNTHSCDRRSRGGPLARWQAAKLS